MDWLTEVDRFFDYTVLPDDRKVKFVAYKLKGGASVWWDKIEGDEDERWAWFDSNMA